MAQIILFHPSNGLLMDLIDTWPPWALIYISAKPTKEYSIKIIDERIEKDWKKILGKELNKDTICVGVTSMTGLQLKYAVDFLKEVKRRMPNVKTVMGGIHATSAPDDTIKENFIDFVVRGDGDTSFYNLVKAIEKGDQYNNIKGICYKNDLGVPVINTAEDFEDLNEIGKLPLHLIDMNKYISIKDGRRRFIMFTARGCPFGCYYCHNSNKFNKSRWRCMSAEKIVEVIEMLIKEYNITYFVFQDDEFWVDKQRVEKFVSLIKQKKLDIKWAVHGATIRSLRYITPEKAGELKRLGLEIIICGIETVSPHIQKLINKHMEIDDFYYVNNVMTKANIKMGYSFMSGFPNETDEDIKMNVDAMLKIKKQSPQNDVGNIKPIIYYPGTRLFDWAVDNGFKPPKTLEEWSDYCWNNYHNLNYPWLSKKRKKFLLDLYFTTFLLNPEYEFIGSRKIWKYVCMLLLPITKWRLRNLYFKFSPTLLILRLFKKINWT